MARTCEQCGADAVDARGVCHHCGWQASDAGFGEDDGAPSLGETRAADVPTAVAEARTPPWSGAMPGRAASEAGHVPLTPPVGAGQPTQFGGQQARYCGTCGARVGPGEAFCGQCGTPVGASGGEYGAGHNMATSAPSRYFVGEGDRWAQEQGDAPTEAYAPTPSMPFNHGIQGAPYSQARYSSGVGMPGAQAAGPSRSARILLGLLCLLGGVASAAGAILLAIPQK